MCIRDSMHTVWEPFVWHKVVKMVTWKHFIFHAEKACKWLEMKRFVVFVSPVFIDHSKKMSRILINTT